MIYSLFDQLLFEGPDIFCATDIIFIVVSILSIIGFCFCFKKTGEKPWKAIIPVYNIYVMCKICWSKKSFVALLIFSLLTGLIYTFLNYFSFSESNLFASEVLYYYTPVIVVIFEIITILLYFTMLLYFVKSFGKGTVFAFGLMFLPFIFTFVLGFNDDKFVGNNFNKQNNK